LALVRIEAVEQQHAVEVVDLVLEEAREHLVGFDLHFVAAQTDPPQRDHLGPDDLEVHPRHGQPPLFGGPLSGGGDDLRVDDRVRTLTDVVGEDAPLHADLRRGQTDADGLVHRLEHRLRQRGEAPVDVLDLAGALLQYGIPEKADGMGRHGWRVPVRFSIADGRAGAHTRSGSTSTRRRPRSRAGVGPPRASASQGTSVDGACTGAREDEPAATGPNTRTSRIARIAAHATPTASEAPLTSANPPNGGKARTPRPAPSAAAAMGGSGARGASVTAWAGALVRTSTPPAPRPA